MELSQNYFFLLGEHQFLVVVLFSEDIPIISIVHRDTYQFVLTDHHPCESVCC